LKLLIAIHGYPPTHYAGAERAAERIAQWMLGHGHEVEVFTLENLHDPQQRVETSQENGVVIHRVYYDVEAGERPFQNSYDNSFVGECFDHLLEQNTYDLVHMVSGYMLGSQIIHTAKSFGIPVVVTLTEFWFMCFRLNLLTASGEMCNGPETDDKCARCLAEDQRRYRVLAHHAPNVMNAFWTAALHTPFTHELKGTVAHRRTLLREALEAADLVICPSRFIYHKFEEFDFDTSRFVYIRHGLTPPSEPVGVSPDSSKGALRLGYVGQIKSHKGVDLIIDAVLPLLDEGHKITLSLWGSKNGAPAYEAGLEGRTAAYPAIQWQGSYKGDQLWSVLSSFDALVVPSRWYENSPTVIAEAFAMGLPVIATRLGGMQELVEHEKSGLLFELNDADDLRQQIRRLLAEPDLLNRLKDGIPSVPSVDDEVGAIYTHYQALIS
jgi:glycosyltransferase involved in cell wall biosynthesis